MIYQMTTEADTPVGIDGVDEWYDRLGWTYGLIASAVAGKVRRVGGSLLLGGSGEVTAAEVGGVSWGVRSASL